MKTKGARNYTDDELELLYTLRVEKGQDYVEVAKQFEILSKFKPGIYERTDTALERKARDLNWHDLVEPKLNNGKNGHIHRINSIFEQIRVLFRRDFS